MVITCKLDATRINYFSIVLISYAFTGSKTSCFFLQAKSNAQKANQRKKWRKSTVPTVVVVPDPSTQSDNAEVPKKESYSISEVNVSMNIPQKMQSSTRPENVPAAPKVEKNVSESDIPLRIPRAMRKQISSNGGGFPLGDVNGSKPDESLIMKESDVSEARSPLKQKRTPEKENSGRY